MGTKSIRHDVQASKRLAQEVYDVDIVRIRGLATEPRLRVRTGVLTIPEAAPIQDFCAAYTFSQQFIDDDLVVRFVGHGEVNFRQPWGQYLFARLYEYVGYDMQHVLEEAVANGLSADDRYSMNAVFDALLANCREELHTEDGGG